MKNGRKKRKNRCWSSQAECQECSRLPLVQGTVRNRRRDGYFKKSDGSEIFPLPARAPTRKPAPRNAGLHRCGHEN